MIKIFRQKFNNLQLRWARTSPKHYVSFLKNKGIIMGQIIGRMLSSIIDILVCGKYIEFYPRKQLIILTKQILAPVVALVIGYLTLMRLESQLEIVKLLVYSLVYIIVFVVLNLAPKNESIVFIKDKIQKLKQ